MIIKKHGNDFYLLALRWESAAVGHILNRNDFLHKKTPIVFDSRECDWKHERFKYTIINQMNIFYHQGRENEGK